MSESLPIAELMVRQKMYRACGVSHGFGSNLVRLENPQVYSCVVMGQTGARGQ